MKKSYIFTLALVFLLIGCAGTVKPLNKSAIENKTVTIVPTGQTDYKVVYQSYTPPLFGAIGGMIGSMAEAAVTKPSSDAAKEKLMSVAPPEFLMQIAINQIQDDISKYGNYKILTSKTHTLKNSLYEDWSKNITRGDLKGSPDIQSDIIMDVGITNLSMNSSFGSYTATVGISLRFINRNSGEMHGEVKETVNSGALGINVNFDESLSSYSALMRDSIEKLIRVGITRGLRKIFLGDIGGTAFPQKSTLAKFTIPNSYETKDLPEGLRVQDAVLWMYDSKKDNSLIVYSFDSTKILGADRLNYVERKLNEANRLLDVTNESTIKTMMVNGVPAWQKETTGILRNGSYKNPITYFQTAYMGENEFILLKQWSAASTYGESKVEFEAIANSLKNLNPINKADSRVEIPATKKVDKAPEKAVIAVEPTSAAGSFGGKSNAAKLTELKSLLDQGLITKQDYEVKKAQILKGI